MNTKLSYKIVTFPCPFLDSDITSRVNNEVNQVLSWAGHMGPVRAVSLSISGEPNFIGRCTLMIEYTSHNNE
jgi:hypothetical protein